MALEQELSSLNEFYFFREFTYANTTFKPKPQAEVELADSVIWLDELLFIYQVKEREIVQTTTADEEVLWFNRKVLGKATKQVRDTLAYLSSCPEIELRNCRGHLFNLKQANVAKMHKIVVYHPSNLLPLSCLSRKYHKSRSAGFIHLFSAVDYLGILRTFLTPAEVADYLCFREQLGERWEQKVEEVPEQAIVGQYLADELDAHPSLEFIQFLQQLDQKVEGWDISRIIKLFPERQTTTTTAPTDYYSIVRELAKLNRQELGNFKERFRLSMDKARTDTFVLPYRFVAPRTGCGFVFIPLTLDVAHHRRNALVNLTQAHKYDQKLEKCIGVSFVADKNRWFDVEWCYLKFPWEPDEEMATALLNNKPFREVRTVRNPRYTFEGTLD